MPFLPNLDCIVTKTSSFDRYGQRTLGDCFRTRCSLVRLRDARELTSVRTDSSASRGNIAETTSDARLLFASSVVMEIGWKVVVAGYNLRITRVFPRYNAYGKLDHYEVDADHWTEGA